MQRINKEKFYKVMGFEKRAIDIPGVTPKTNISYRDVILKMEDRTVNFNMNQVMLQSLFDFLRVIDMWKPNFSQEEKEVASYLITEIKKHFK